MDGVETMTDQHVDEMTSYLDWSDKGKASFWRYLLGFVLAILIFFVLGSVVVMPLSAIKPDYAKSPSFSLIGTLLSFLVLFVASPLIVNVAGWMAAEAKLVAATPVIVQAAAAVPSPSKLVVAWPPIVKVAPTPPEPMKFVDAAPLIVNCRAWMAAAAKLVAA